MLLLPPVATGYPQLDIIHCCRAEQLLKALPDNCIDMVLTSPPYDSLRLYSGDYSFDFQLIARETYRVLKQGGVLVWVVGDATVNGSETLTSMRQALYFVDVCGFKMHDTMIWQKDGSPFPESNRYLQTFEYMFVMSKGTPGTCNQLKVPTVYRKAGHTQSDGNRRRDGTLEVKKYEVGKEFRTRDNVWYVTSGYMKTTQDIIAYEHPAMFPEQLVNDHIYSWSNPGDIVLDYFMGSGTTAKIARNLGRKFIGCDVSAEYVALANRRLVNSDPMQDTVLPDGSKQLSLFRELLSEGIAS